MLPIHEKIARHAETSLKLARRESLSFDFAWHQHPEVELTLIESGSGQRFVGDSIEPYRPGDLVLLGSDLPHTWASHPNGGQTQRAIVAQFDPMWLIEMFANTPEAGAVVKLLERSRRGLRFTGPARKHMSAELPTLLEMRGMTRVLGVVRLLDVLGHSRGIKELASPAYHQHEHKADPRVDRVCKFIHDHATEPITQGLAAELIHMSGPAFSRFFRQRVGMTYSRYVHELRVGHACRLLLETDATITEACFASGFNNVSNFNRVFLAIKGVSPRRYRQSHTSKRV